MTKLVYCNNLTGLYSVYAFFILIHLTIMRRAEIYLYHSVERTFTIRSVQLGLLTSAYPCKVIISLNCPGIFAYSAGNLTV